MNKPFLEELRKKALELEKILIDRKTIADPTQYSIYLKEYGVISPVLKKYEQYRLMLKQKSDTKTLINKSEPELRDLALEELKEVENKILNLEAEISSELRKLNKETDEHEDNAIIEIRAGTGGEEAALFSADVLRMYLRYAEKKEYKTEMISSRPTGLKGFKEVIFLIEGENAFRDFKYESGTHRVQRIPLTEASDRIHTSTVTVAVLPEVDEINVEIKPEDLKIDTYRASGHGGQHIQKTDSAVRITHIPSGIVVQCQDERSQLKNREKAMKLLRSRLFALMKERQEMKISTERKEQVGGAKRAEKIRTYNFPQNRVTDHRINLSIYNLKSFLDGEIDEMVERLREKLSPGYQVQPLNVDE